MTSPANGQSVDLNLLADLAERLAITAGSEIVSMRDNAVKSAVAKSSPTDPVTAADQAAEAIVVAGLAKERPNDGLVGEEGANQVGSTGLEWLIDPIDGTVNYLYDLPAYSVSIAARAVDSGKILAGVVYNPVTRELFRAVQDGGATLNGKTISASDKLELATTLVGTGFSYSATRRQAQARVLVELLGRARDIRRFGSAALDLCSVACGRLDVYYESGLNPWDFGAGWLIATEAGAICDDLRGGQPSPTFTVAAAPGVAQQFGDLLRELEADKLPIE